MPAVDVNELRYEDFTLTQADFTNGRDESSSVAQGTIGEVAQLEVGEDGQASAYDAVIIGQPLSGTGQSAQGKAFVALDSDDSNTDVADTVEWRIATRDKNSNRRRVLTPWFKQRDSDNSDTRQRIEITPEVVRQTAGKLVIPKAGRLIVFEVKDETASVTVDRSGSEIELPAQGGL